MLRAPRIVRTARVAAGALVAAACVSTSVWERPLPEGEIERRLEASHAAEAWRAHEVLELELAFAFADVEYDARVWVEVDGGRSRLESGGTVLVDDGEAVWVSPPDAAFPGPEFHARLYGALLALPYSLGAADTVALRGKRVWQERRLALIEAAYPAGRGGLLGDTQWLYVDPQSERVEAVGFRLALFEDARYGNAITFRDPIDVAGVPLASYMQAFSWSEDRSIVPGHIASIAVASARFVEAAPGRFEPPRGARRAASAGLSSPRGAGAR